jgi:hypothetical protein
MEASSADRLSVDPARVVNRLGDCRQHHLDGCHMNFATKLILSAAAEAVAAWNARFPVDTPVVTKLPNGRLWATKTRARAQLLSDGTAVVWLAGRLGSFALDHVQPTVEGIVQR